MKNRTKILLIGACVLLLLFAAELVLRTNNWKFQQLFVNDPVLGKLHQKNGTFHHIQPEFITEIKTNSQGFVDREHILNKNNDTLRIVVLGGSYTEGLQVNYSQRWTTRLEEKLNDLGNSVEVFNFAVNGYGTGQQYLLLKEKVIHIQPDVILLEFFLYDDVRNNHPSLESEPYKPFFSIENNQLTQLLEPTQQSALRKYLSKSALIVWLFQKMSRQKAQDISLPISYSYFKVGQQEVWRQSWEITMLLLIEMQKIANRYHAEFIIIEVPHRILVDDRYWEAQLGKYGSDAKNFNRTLRLKNLHEFALQQNITFLSLQTEFRKRINENQTIHYPLDGHPTPLGHEVIATRVANKIEKEFLN